MPADRTAPCPDCGSPVRPDVEQLCPNCGYPLMFLRGPEPDTGGRSVARAPGARDDATAMMPGGPAPPPGLTPTQPLPTLTPATAPTGGQIDCNRCGYRNDAERTRCERCGAELRNVWPVSRVLPPPEHVRAGPRRSRAWIAVLAAVLAVVALVALVAFLLLRGRGDSAPSGAAPRSAGGQVPAGLVPVSLAGVRATASSTNPEARFKTANMLDGDRQTMWQSDGAKLDGNVGVKVTFTFPGPVPLARVTVVNGAAIDETSYAENERVAAMLVHTEAGTTAWQLADSADPQSLALKPGPTTAVTFEIKEVYAGRKWPDLALTDVSFDRQP
jgi:hypothetical protein